MNAINTTHSKGGPLKKSDTKDKSAFLELNEHKLPEEIKVKGQYQNWLTGKHIPFEVGVIKSKNGFITYVTEEGKLLLEFEEFYLYANGSRNPVHYYKNKYDNTIFDKEKKIDEVPDNLFLDYYEEDKMIRDVDKVILLLDFEIDLPDGEKLIFKKGHLNSNEDENLLDKTMVLEKMPLDKTMKAGSVGDLDATQLDTKGKISKTISI